MLLQIKLGKLGHRLIRASRTLPEKMRSSFDKINSSFDKITTSIKKINSSKFKKSKLPAKAFKIS